MNFRRMTRQMAWGYLALVLLLAPLLGLMHGVVHGGNDGSPSVRVQPAGPENHAHARGWVDDLFSAHRGASDCRVFDQLNDASALPALPLLVLPMVLPSFVFHFLEGEVLARRAALFEARGPPLAP